MADQRGECNCGKCFDRGNKPDPEGHTADVHFFKVAAANDPDPEVFKQLTREHKGAFAECDPFDGNEHNYIELGGWLGDQGMALLYMGLGSVLGLFTLLTPKSVLGDAIDDAFANQLAGIGMVAIKAKPMAAPV
jgi:hypothetical protein